ncbi:MAG: tetratricopeptide repeat protein [Pirellulales bacterium]
MSWADRWLLKVSGTEPWHACCWYQIARSLEQLGRTEEAIEMYKRSPSSQEAGNRIRARLLGK